MDIREKIKEILGAKILDWKEHSARRIYIAIDKKDIVESTRALFKDLGLRFSTIVAVETLGGFELLYHFSYDKSGECYSLRTAISGKDKPEIASITPLFAGAEWIERETWELMGINFTGHPNLTHLLLMDEWPDGKYPLRRKE